MQRSGTKSLRMHRRRRSGAAAAARGRALLPGRRVPLRHPLRPRFSSDQIPTRPCAFEPVRKPAHGSPSSPRRRPVLGSRRDATPAPSGAAFSTRSARSVGHTLRPGLTSASTTANPCVAVLRLNYRLRPWPVLLRATSSANVFRRFIRVFGGSSELNHGELQSSARAINPATLLRGEVGCRGRRCFSRDRAAGPAGGKSSYDHGNEELSIWWRDWVELGRRIQRPGDYNPPWGHHRRLCR